MAGTVLSVPLTAELRSEMDKHREIKWVEIARQAIAARLKALDMMDLLLENSELTEQDAVKHGKAVKKAAWAARN